LTLHRSNVPYNPDSVALHCLKVLAQSCLIDLLNDDLLATLLVLFNEEFKDYLSYHPPNERVHKFSPHNYYYLEKKIIKLSLSLSHTVVKELNSTIILKLKKS
jgi:hypothetical protein